ncbi:hypothetical protein JCM30471_27350 [Desulfuromonas carbonis]
MSNGKVIGVNFGSASLARRLDLSNDDLDLLGSLADTVMEGSPTIRLANGRICSRIAFMEELANIFLEK